MVNVLPFPGRITFTIAVGDVEIGAYALSVKADRPATDRFGGEIHVLEKALDRGPPMRLVASKDP